MTDPTDLSTVLDFMEEDGGFTSPPMPSTKFPKGKTYRIPSPNAIVGLRLAAIADITLKQARGKDLSPTDVKRLRIEDEDEHEFIAQVLSPETVAEMESDGVKFAHMKRLGLYAFTYFAVSPEAAETALKNGVLQGKVSAPPNRAARRSSSKGKTSTTSASGASRKATKRG